MTEAGAAFTQLLDRGIIAEGRLAAWCPTMDLLALATADGQLHVHRLNWQRLWWSSPDAAITALEWRPDGKQLAVGLEDGTVMLLNTEDGEVQHKAKLLAEALVAISWTEAAAAGAAAAAQPGSSSSSNDAAPASNQLSGDRTRRMFAPPPPPVPLASAGLAVGYATCGRRSSSSQGWPPEPARLAVLACASSAGELVLCSSGLFPLASLPLPALLGRPTASVLRLATAPSLQQLTICWSDGGSSSSSGGSATAGSSSSSGGTLHLSTLSMRHIGAHAAQLHRLALAAAHVAALLEGCRQSCQAACKEWESGMREFGASRDQLANLMANYGLPADPAGELQRLLATGAVSGALQQYISSTLGEGGLKKLARAVDAAVCSVHNLLTDHLQPQLEQLAFRLGELRGLALCLPWRRVTGLQPDQVGAAEQLALRLVMSAEAARRRLVQAGAQYRTFCAWLLIIVRRLQEDAPDAMAGYPRSHLECVGDFLAGEYQRDGVGPLLGSSSGGGGSSSDQGLGATAAGGGAAAGSGSGGGSSTSSMLDVVMEMLGRQALVQAADSSAGFSPRGGTPGTASSSGSGSGSLAQLLADLQAACSAAFDRTSETISPTVAVADSFSLGPAPSALSGGYLPAQPGAAAAVAWEGQQRVLVLRGAGIEASTSAGSSSGEPAGLEAALVQLPAGSTAVDLAFYKEGQLALLLAGGSSDDGSGACRLLLLPQEQLQFVALPADLLADSDACQLSELLLDSSTGSGSGAPLPPDCRQRAVPYPRVQPPLAVSATRGVGCVLAGTQRVLLYDLEEDEEEDEEEEQEEGEKFAEAGGGADMESDDAGYQSPN